ncbi:MAG: hypothetical protein NC340_05335 [Ruminococcus flavefaciens]|nr:hypothetical protein [Ruminococcus flavefaciens]MCM1231047.1 hypothetical protein [Ruminococcus flavefaciens]
MEGNFRDGKNTTATIVGIIIFMAGFIATVIISVSVGDFGAVFMLPGIILTLLLGVAVESELSKGKFSADEKLVDFSVGFKKYRYFYTSIINIRTEIIFINGRGGSKIPYIELALSLRNGKIVRFSDTVPSYECDTLENLKKYQKNHQFTELACYIKSRL